MSFTEIRLTPAQRLILKDRCHGKRANEIPFVQTVDLRAIAQQCPYISWDVLGYLADYFGIELIEQLRAAEMEGAGVVYLAA